VHQVTDARGGSRRSRRQSNGRPFVISAKSRVGRLRRCIKRAFIVSDGRPLTTSEILARAYPRRTHYPCGLRWRLRLALLREAELIGRTLRGRGRPCLWAPKMVETCTPVANALPNN
jgi:hypothetical protein